MVESFHMIPAHPATTKTTSDGRARSALPCTIPHDTKHRPRGLSVSITIIWAGMVFEATARGITASTFSIGAVCPRSSDIYRIIIFALRGVALHMIPRSAFLQRFLIFTLISGIRVRAHTHTIRVSLRRRLRALHSPKKEDHRKQMVVCNCIGRTGKHDGRGTSRVSVSTNKSRAGKEARAREGRPNQSGQCRKRPCLRTGS
jgi:hypothetical protein